MAKGQFVKFKECYPRFLESQRASATILKEQLENPLFREFVDVDAHVQNAILTVRNKSTKEGFRLVWQSC
jgi:hypothetical protein